MVVIPGPICLGALVTGVWPTGHALGHHKGLGHHRLVPHFRHVGGLDQSVRHRLGHSVVDYLPYQKKVIYLPVRQELPEKKPQSHFYIFIPPFLIRSFLLINGII